jgi:hypothetical protein
LNLPLVVNGSTGGGNGAPTLETQGGYIRRGHDVPYSNGLADVNADAEILVEGATSGSGSIAYIRIWGWYPGAIASNKWFPLGIGTDANKGKLNNSNALGETGTNIIRHAEVLGAVRGFTKLYAQYGAITNVTRVDITVISRD